MVISLAVLAYLVWLTMTGGSKTPNSSNGANTSITNKATTSPVKSSERFQNQVSGFNDNTFNAAPLNPTNGDVTDNLFSHRPEPTTDKNSNGVTRPPLNVTGVTDNTVLQVATINKTPEGFQNKVTNSKEMDAAINNKVNSMFGPNATNSSFNKSNDSAINYSTDVPSSPSTTDVNDIYQVEGTDLLVAPLADRFYNTNSIANVNRNASHDFRGDIPTSYNDNFTPFYQSAIYGEPMTVNRLGDCSVANK